MPCNRLVKDRHWLLAPPETLQMSSGQPLMLQHRLEDHASRESVHTPSGVTLCSYLGGSPSGGQRTRPGQALCPSM